MMPGDSCLTIRPLRDAIKEFSRCATLLAFYVNVSRFL